MYQGQVGPSGDDAERSLILCQIILMHMERFNIRASSLANVRRIRHKNIKKRLQDGKVARSELGALMEHLQIDSINAYLCANVFGRPEAYYDGQCTFMTALMPEIAHHLGEAGPALSGDFGSLKSNLCKLLARRLVQDVIKHNQIVAQAPLKAFE